MIKSFYVEAHFFGPLGYFLERNVLTDQLVVFLLDFEDGLWRGWDVALRALEFEFESWTGFP